MSRLPARTRRCVLAAGECWRPVTGRSATGRPAAGRFNADRRGRSSTRAGLAAAVLTAAALAVTGCDGGAIGANTPVSSGQNFVGSSYQSTFFKVGSRAVAPAVSGPTVSGNRLSLGAYKGDVIVLNFWGSWCPPCRAEAPALGQLARQMYPTGVRFVGIDIRDQPDAAMAFMQDFGVTYPSINDPNDDIALLFRSTDPPAAIPSTIVIDRTGRIAARIIGGATYQSLKALIGQVATGRA